MFSMILEKKASHPSRRPEKIVACLEWLLQNNDLYRQFKANFETIMHYMNADPDHATAFKYYSTSTFTSGKKDVSLADQLGEEQMALLVPREDIPGDRDWDMCEIPAAVCYERALEIHREITRVYYGQKSLEEKVFPVQHRYGTGGWFKARDHKIGRQGLTSWHLDMLYDGFRTDSNYPFYQLDSTIKDRIGAFNNVSANVKDLEKQLTVDDLNEQKEGKKRDPYGHFGTKIPTTSVNSKQFCQSHCMNLIALSEKLQRQPNFLLTLSQNDNWPEIQAVIEGGIGKSSMFLYDYLTAV